MTSDSSPLTPPMPEPTIGLTGYSGHDGNEIITVNRAGFDDVCIWGTQGWAEVERLTSEVQALREENGKLQQFAEAIVLENQDRKNSQANLRAKLEEAEAALDGLDLDEWPGGVGEIEAAFESNLALRLKAEAERDAALGALNAARADAERLAGTLRTIADEARRVLIETPSGREPMMMAPWVAGTAYEALAQHREGK